MLINDQCLQVSELRAIVFRRPPSLRRSLLALSPLLGFLLAVPAPGGPVRFVNQVVRPESRIALTEIDHAEWDALLVKYVDNDGNVNYRQWKQSPADLAQLTSYLQLLGTARNVDAAAGETREAVLAFWINAYNAMTVEGILREYPTSSIRNHTARLFGYNIWKDLQLRVAGTDYSLEDIEHRVLRTMGEPRIHFAIVCASRSCPRLLNKAYTAEKLECQLQTNSLDFFARQQNFQFDARTQSFRLSSILNWFSQDFGQNQTAVLKRIASWLPDETARRAASMGRGRIRYIDYDWNLNERERP